MITILLSIGSNTFAKTNIDKAKRMLTRQFPNIVFSDPILTEPEDDKYSYLFRNILAKVETGMLPDQIIEKIKQTERAVGRTPKDKYLGKVVIDIDLIKYGDDILRPLDYEREYVQQLIGTFDTLSPSDSDSASASDSEPGTVD
ncbi:MAG: 2-amino-4-hydroxy-6-hydroxymethyldihydropteridine diphosphokinase [Proteiniphilum sp.]|nr:2-amino-4-hydroxy-6-hydroxymethyldihydropteridine diphosphokinase [Proteiniphilum sp.]MDD3908910.1 2-amino-4-hydroxy-6-hydroxymethyldihydropteridine diphosphokinase [Proteiniphilum sp.]MDD4415914.1 2-amino-4-hydroxy-6-hydroxymethyldihydropteridine diphosphokinase [Proteiniphilum sp.]HHV41355.1 7,8-dihydro-6-hydroxymethylpterin-pyrophosphokinase [Clostridiaceae bacterium]